MKKMINFTTTEDDTCRFKKSSYLRRFYEYFDCDGLEVMPFSIPCGYDMLPPFRCPIVEPDMVIGVHLNCPGDWMERDKEGLIKCYRRDLEYARQMNAEYVVFHVTQVSDKEVFTYQMQHTDEEVILAAASLVNELLLSQDYRFYFLMENLWWPGLNFLNPDMTSLLLESVRYEKKGLMLDTGHFLHTNLALTSQAEAVSYLNKMLDAHEELLPHIKGVHLHQSLTGSFVKNALRHPPSFLNNPEMLACLMYSRIFAIDQHLPFTDPGVKTLLERIDPQYLTYEYITRSRQELARYLLAGRIDRL